MATTNRLTILKQALRWTPLVAALMALFACRDEAESGRYVQIQRTGYGIAHIEAPDYESLAYGIAYAHAADNVCQTASQLVTIRGERSRYFGADDDGLLGLRMLPNEQIDIFIRAHMNDKALAAEMAKLGAAARDSARGYVAGYNRYLAEHEESLPPSCKGKAWVRPMTAAEFVRLQELTMVQLGIGLLADAMVAASPPAVDAAPDSAIDPDEAAAALAPYRFNEPLLGSNGWAFGADVTKNGRGVLLGNPHFPWAGVNRFWEMHLTIPGELDVMGAAIGHSPFVQIGFNRDVSWTHTVSTGKRFTLHELQLVPGRPTRYVLDGNEQEMTPQQVTYEVLADDGTAIQRTHTVWNTQFGPVVTIPRAGLGWTAEHAYALQDANTHNLRSLEIWVGFNRARDVAEMRTALGRLGIPWVNTMAADRNGDVMYADVSVVPDVPDLEDCAPSTQAARLFATAGLVVLDGSRVACDWHRDDASPVPGLLPIERMPVAVRRDWVQNSNDSFWLSNPAIAWDDYSPLIGATGNEQTLRTRSGLKTIRERLAAADGIAEHGQVGLEEIQAMLFANRNEAAELVLDDLLTVCRTAREKLVGEGCTVLAAWDRRNDLASSGEQVFREWWRAAGDIDNVWREPFDPERPSVTPAGLNTDDDAVRTAVLAALDDAVRTVRQAGFALDAPLGDVQFHAANGERVGLHGGPQIEGLLNKVETLGIDTLPASGYAINFGSSYIQTVTFDDAGPVAEAVLTYGQSSQQGSPYDFDQLSVFAREQLRPLPFHAGDVESARVGEVVRLDIE